MRSINDFTGKFELGGVEKKPPAEKAQLAAPLGRAPVRIPAPLDHPKARWRVIVKKDMDKEAFYKWVSTIPGLIEGLTCDVEGEPTRLYDYQIEHMLNWCKYRHIDKARQVGFSYVFALESLAKALLSQIHTSIFISYNQEEANEKIRFVRQAEDTIPSEYKKKIVVNNVQSMEFDHNGKRSRILSFAQRQPRGKGYNTWIYLDEFAHMNWPEMIYTASLPVIVRGDGNITVASTPLGTSSMHHQIATDRHTHGMFSRMRVYWWDCEVLCKNVEEARRLAPLMSTEERVERFGTIDLKAQLSAQDIDWFKQEFELHYADEALSYYPDSIVRPCVFDIMGEDEGNIDPKEFVAAWETLKTDDGRELKVETIMQKYDMVDSWHCGEGSVTGSTEDMDDRARDLAYALRVMINSGQITDHLVAGIDIGRKKNTSELSIFEQRDVGNINVIIERCMFELDNVKFEDQKRLFSIFMDMLPIRKLFVDMTGIGMDIAEYLTDKYSGRVTGIEFDLENKAEMAKGMRFRFEDRVIAVKNNHDSLKQIKSIKRTVTDRSNVTYASDKKTKHHGDKFWAKALACLASDPYDREAVPGTTYKADGDRLFTDGINDRVSNNMVLPVTVNPANILTQMSKDSYLGLFFDGKFHG